MALSSFSFDNVCDRLILVTELILILLSLLVLVLLVPAFYRVKNYNIKILLLVILEVFVVLQLDSHNFLTITTILKFVATDAGKSKIPWI